MSASMPSSWATWPAGSERYGLLVNRSFRLGQDQQIAYPPQAAWIVPADGDPQAFKDALLRQHFTPAELAARDAFIVALSQGMSS